MRRIAAVTTLILFVSSATGLMMSLHRIGWGGHVHECAGCGGSRHTDDGERGDGRGERPVHDSEHCPICVAAIGYLKFVDVECSPPSFGGERLGIVSFEVPAKPATKGIRHTFSSRAPPAC